MGVRVMLEPNRFTELHLEGRITNELCRSGAAPIVATGGKQDRYNRKVACPGRRVSDSRDTSGPRQSGSPIVGLPPLLIARHHVLSFLSRLNTVAARSPVQSFTVVITSAAA